MPRFTICIPAYNRAALLPPLLDSISAQEYADYEILICEDASPERSAIRAVAEEYSTRYPERIRYVENERNLGYDGNLRTLARLAAGDYCLFMGNDDLMCAGALAKAASALARHSDVGVLVRSYADFQGAPENIDQEYRYFPDERFFPAGPDAVATAFRRSVVISGMVLHRTAALSFSTDRFDGSLLYQVWLVGNILVEKNVVFVPDILILRRKGVPPDFGQAEAERGLFTPQDQTPESSLNFMRGMLGIAAAVEKDRGIKVYRRIVTDIANYSYPVLSIQAGKPLVVFLGYWWQLSLMGFGVSLPFHAYFTGLMTLGAPRLDRLIRTVKRRLGRTPSLGNIFQGRAG